MGRAAVMLCDRPSDADLNAELLHACTNNLTYDRQEEESRVSYLHELIRITGQAGAYRAVLEARLTAATSAENVGDGEQVFGILSRLAAQDGSGQDMLRRFVLSTENRTLAMIGVWEFVRMQGIEALLACVDHFGPAFAANPWLINDLVNALEERDGGPAAAAALQQARRNDVVLDRLLRLNEAKPAEDEQPTTTFDYAALKGEIARGDREDFLYVCVKVCQRSGHRARR